MKSVVRILIGIIIATLAVTEIFAQKTDEQRMERDIEVAENILSTLIRQQFEKRYFFPLEANGSYMSGYGVIFKLPGDFLGPLIFSTGDREGNIMSLDVSPNSYSFGYVTPDVRVERGMERKAKELEEKSRELEEKSRELEETSREMERDAGRMERDAAELSRRVGGFQFRSTGSDSAREVYKAKIIEASKIFLTDYGDLIGQLGADERIMITNRNESNRFVWGGNSQMKNSYLSVEASKGDIQQYRGGKISRDQFMTKIKVVNTESVDKVEPDLELLSSIFSRLYRSDLSQTFFTDDRIYYDRLKDFGVIYYMKVYSSNSLSEPGRHSMPTAGLKNVSKEERDKKVKELVPQFEQEVKRNILDYGRTVKSLAENETITFNIKLTKCEGCGIPSSIEVSVKASVLTDYNTGKITKENAMTKFTVKRGESQ